MVATEGAVIVLRLLRFGETTPLTKKSTIYTDMMVNTRRAWRGLALFKGPLSLF